MSDTETGATATTADLDELAELEEQRAFVRRSLDDLEREWEAGDLDERDYHTLRADYSARLADLDRAVAAGRTALPPRRGRNPLKLVAAVVLLALCGGLAGWGVARASGERVAGQPATGSIRESNDQKLQNALQLFNAGKPVDALKALDALRTADPKYVPAIAYRGWLLRLAGRSAGNTELIDEGMKWLDQAIAVDPAYPDSHFFKGLILLQDRNDPAAAVPELRAAMANNPPQEMASTIQGILAQAEAAAAGAMPPGAKPASPTTTTP